MSDPPPASIADAQISLKKKHPNIQFLSFTPSFLTVSCARSATARVKVKATLTFPDDYNSTTQPAIIVTVEGTNVPPGLKRKLEKELGAQASSSQNKQHTFHQIHAILSKLSDFLQTNHFVPCWKELRQVVDLVNNSRSKDDKITMNETTGLVRLTIKPGKYTYKCSITIDPEYPNTHNITDYGKPCRLKLESTNLPTSIEAPITKQAMDLVRRLQDGMPETYALKMSNPVHLPTNGASASAAKQNETPEEAWQRQDQERRKLYGVPLDSPYDGSDEVLPSLLPLVKFLHSTLHDKIPKQTCPGCSEKVLAADPTKQSKLKKNLPLQAHCRCLYHWGCMNQLMNEPPFGIKSNCSECSHRLYHPVWTEEQAPEREKMYQQRQAKEREISDVADFF